MLNRLAVFLIGFAALSGCASTPESPWNNLTVDTDPAATPIECGSFPMPTEVVGESVIYDNAGLNVLDRYRVCAEANHDIAAEHALQIGQLKIARASLVDAGQSQRMIAEMRSEQLDDERKHNTWMSIGYWVVIIGLGSAL